MANIPALNGSPRKSDSTASLIKDSFKENVNPGHFILKPASIVY